MNFKENSSLFRSFTVAGNKVLAEANLNQMYVHSVIKQQMKEKCFQKNNCANKTERVRSRVRNSKSNMLN